MAMIEVRNVCKVFGPKPQDVLPLIREGAGKEEVLAQTGHAVGLADVSLSMEAGKTFVVMGLSGSGKSTLIRHLNRLIDPTAGEIVVDGVDVLTLPENELIKFRRRKTSMVFQRFGLFPHRTVLDNVAYGLTIQRVPKPEREQRARNWIDAVGLSGYEDSYPHQLSGGMQQRVGLARALATDPDILLMDEAFSALDPLIRSDMQDQLIELQNRLHKTIVFITHDLDEALKLGDRIAILKDGYVVQVGGPQEILLNPADDYVAAFIKDVNRSRVITAGTVMTEPPILALNGASPSDALDRLREMGQTYAYVVNAARKLQGVLTEAALRRAASESAHSVNGELQTVPAVSHDATLDEVLPLTLQTDWPVAVIDESGALIGMVATRSVIAALAGRAKAES
ncbi:MAG: glycine betaine/L-proline ABC transporter ATP-binding protein [Gammaproteobacteria bacterium]|nr:glycine betaine/L-proline ABC transporter ATP-binding protein [Gammaproteobacteria bacterium]NIR82633.1 glycine betaine/L-proline ABC transporter ATP-binding protein [Gammaproteobacteria bacterium]NIR89096.1 glycine betaine/L-proline ABC transporter ATP-binding protein [Gammaproteobacteria bacterium]NIU03792.1 glycine betaine/L-proline ABC transporter ATP-binding protein [Gammaproteobacteria bacterium]NIV51129.1 betaine/proline/choline family ABC transporter ATP-binding protein [Gammaproteob